MSNYTKTTDFEAKDSLPSGDSGKIIRGSEFETEFDNIATAIATKADAADPTFTGTVTIDGLTVNGNTTLGNAATDTVTVTADIASNLIPSADDTYNLGASGAEWNDLYVDGTAYIDAINFNGTAITATAAELNTLDGITATTAELNIMDGVTATTAELNYVDGVTSAIQTQLDSKANLSGANFTGNIDVTGSVTADSLIVDGDAQINSTAPKLTFVESDTTDLNTRLRIAGGSFQYHTANDAENTFTRRLQIDNSTGDVSFYEDTGTTAKFFWDASAERLGIGNSSPTTTLDVTGTVTIDGSTIVNGNITANGASPYIYLTETDTTDVNTRLRNAAGNLQVHTANDAQNSFTARMNISHSTGDISFYDAGGTSQDLYWDASTSRLGIGGSTPSEKLEVSNGSAIDSGEISIKLGGDVDNNARTMTITKDTSTPYNTIINTQNNTAVTTGSLVFKNGSTEQMRVDSSGHLIVPNGVTLGTAVATYAAANTLDDYEEGTWTPEYTAATPFTSITYDSATYGEYTKVGNLVHIQGVLRTDAISGGSGVVTLTGLPFTVATGEVASLCISYSAAFAGDFPASANIAGGGTTANFRYRTTANGALSSNLDVSDLGTGANANYLIFSGTYVTTA